MDGQQNTQTTPPPPPQQEDIVATRQKILNTIVEICNEASIGSPALRALKDIREIYDIAAMDAEIQMQGESDAPSTESVACATAQNSLAREINDRRVMMPGYAEVYDLLLVQGELLLDAENKSYQANNGNQKVIPPQAVSTELAGIIEAKLKNNNNNS